MTSLLLTLCLLQDPLDATLDALLPKLAAESLEERSKALEHLKTLAKKDVLAARPVLKTRLSATTDLEVAAALRAALDSLPKLELRLALKDPWTVGGELKLVPKLTARIRNVSDGEICLPAFRAMEWLYPFEAVQFDLSDPEGRVHLKGRRFVKCGLAQRRIPTPEDFVKLAPGAETDYLAPVEGAPPHLFGWEPKSAGRFLLRVSFDWTAPTADDRVPPEVRATYDKVLRERLSAELGIEVEEKK